MKAVAKRTLLILFFICCGVSFAQSTITAPTIRILDIQNRAIEHPKIQIPANQILAIQRRIALADETFREELRNTPDKSIAATIFFANEMLLDRVREPLENAPLTIKGFLHGTPSDGGGYTLNPGETLDDAIANYRRDHLSVMEKIMESAARMAAVETDHEAREALISHLRKAEDMKFDLRQKGIRIVGVELYGKAKELADFRDKNSFVKVIELKVPGKPQPAILPLGR
ncbi:MAG: hypothetical protein JWQ23_3682 [Herminiimonas sp.]|nr:hypothetical protein [Herminiimonas sp.]